MMTGWRGLECRDLGFLRIVHSRIWRADHAMGRNHIFLWGCVKGHHGDGGVRSAKSPSACVKAMIVLYLTAAKRCMAPDEFWD